MPTPYAPLAPDPNTSASDSEPTTTRSIPLRPPPFEIPDPFAPFKRERTSIDSDDSTMVGFFSHSKQKKLGDNTGPWTDSRPVPRRWRITHMLLKLIDNPPIWGIFALPQIEFAVDERTVLIGDAAHATTPHQGAGAGQAVEDALFLSALLASPSTSSTPLSSRSEAISKALKIYQQERHSRAQKV
ncbi:hypothetical protein JCM5353_002811 [Sporobolomyces roseus]